MTTSFDDYDPSHWHESGVLLQPQAPSGQPRTSRRRSTGWTMEVVFPIALAAFSVGLVVIASDTGLSMAAAIHEDPEEAKPDDDLVGPGYWARAAGDLRLAIGALKPEIDVEIPELEDLDIEP